MPYERKWDGCKVYSKWKTDGGVTWTVEDIPPEDYDKATQIMTTVFIKDEPMFSRLDFGVSVDETSVSMAAMYWTSLLEKRCSIACYRHCEGQREIAGLNIAFVKSIDDPPREVPQIENNGLKLYVESMRYLESVVNIYEVLKTDQYLGGGGLVVIPKYRGNGIATKILLAREALCRELKMRSTAAFFTGLESQKPAANSGFRALAELSYAELVEAGFHFPGDQNKTIMIMYRTYNIDNPVSKL